MPGRLAEAMPLYAGESVEGVLLAGARMRWELEVRRLEQLVDSVARERGIRYYVLPSTLGPLPVGTFMAYDGGWVKADNTNALRRALLVVAGATSGGYLSTAERLALPWPNHGISPGRVFYLDTAGDVTTTVPGSVRVFQRLGVGLDANTVLLEWDTPGYEA